MPTLEIENTVFDLSDIPVPITKKVFDIADFSVRNISFSDSVNLPDSEDARKLFQRPEDISLKADRFKKWYDFKYKDNGTMLFNGVAKLLTASNGIELQLVDGAKKFFDELTENINQLDFDSDDFVFGAAAYNTLKNLNSSVFVWSLVSMHESRTAANLINLAYSRPFLSVTRIFDKIFADNGWTYSKSPELAGIPELAISTNAKQFNLTSYQKTINIVSGDGVDGFLSDLGTNDFNFGITVAASQLDLGTKKTRFRLRGYIISSVDSVIEIQGLSAPLGTDKLFQTFDILTGRNYYDITTDEFSTAEVSNIIKIYIRDAVYLEDFKIYTVIEEQNLGIPSANANVGYLVKYSENCPEISQLDFLKNYFSMFGLVFNSENFKKSLSLFSIQKPNKNAALDWSDKFVQGSESITGTPDNFGQNNYYTFENDATLNAAFGRGKFTIPNRTLTSEVDFLKNLFSASKEVVIGTDTVADFNVYSDAARINSINDRIIAVNGLNGQFAQITGQVLVTNYMKKIVSNLQNVVEADFYLNRNDFLSFNFQKPVYIEFFKSTFIVLEISSYIYGRKTKCTLLKLT